MLFEIGSNIALCIDERLFAYIISRNLAQFAVADLDVVAKDFVIAYFEQLVDTGTFALVSF